MGARCHYHSDFGRVNVQIWVIFNHKIETMPPLKPNLTDDQRAEIVQFLCDCARTTVLEDGSVTRILPRGLIKNAAQRWDVHRNTIASVWSRAK